jgi:N-acetylglucosamine malate deacetylase 2
MAAIVAHPDDETIGCGALLARARSADVVIVTHGASSSTEFLRKVGAPSMEAHAVRRLGELRDALTIAAVDPARAYSLNVEDGGVWRAMDTVVSASTSMFA